MVSLSRNKPRGPPGRHAWRNSRLWHSVPPDDLFLDGINEHYTQDSSDPIVSTVLFGGRDKHLIEIAIWAVDGARVERIDFVYTNRLQNECLGNMVPAGMNYQRTPLAINNAWGEELEGIEVKEMPGYVAALKVYVLQPFYLASTDTIVTFYSFEQTLVERSYPPRIPC